MEVCVPGSGRLSSSHRSNFGDRHTNKAGAAAANWLRIHSRLSPPPMRTPLRSSRVPSLPRHVKPSSAPGGRPRPKFHKWIQSKRTTRKGRRQLSLLPLLPSHLVVGTVALPHPHPHPPLRHPKLDSVPCQPQLKQLLGPPTCLRQSQNWCNHPCPTDRIMRLPPSLRKNGW
jgi:hypothetical protein